MILIADSGSTKCDWHVYDKFGVKLFQKSTIGINPQILCDLDIKKVFQQLRNDIKYEVSQVEFYCAGGNHKESKKKLNVLFEEYFFGAKIIIEDDLEMALKCTNGASCIVCILGTGSNSCFFDGSKIHKKLPDLGYQVMDEGSGNYFGRELLRSYAYGYMPDDLKNSFEENYNLDNDSILENLYQGENPSSYLANFAKFLIQNQEHNFIKGIIDEGVKKVFDHVLGPYTLELKKYPLYFVGSIVFFLQNPLRKEAHLRSYQSNHFIKKPIEYIIR